jgi:serine protease Do
LEAFSVRWAERSAKKGRAMDPSMSEYARAFRAVLFLLQIVMVTCSPAVGQTVHEQIRNSLVFIEIKGENDQGMILKTAGTGFFVSEDGYILTSNHLLEGMRNETVDIAVYFWERKSASDKKAFVIDSRPSLDLLLLKVPRARTPYSAVSTRSTRGMASPTSLAVFTAGFRSASGDGAYLRYGDQITSEDGPEGYTWTLEKTATAIQSGSPIYTQTGDVIGILKGVALTGGITTFVPIEHAAALLLPISASAQKN